MSVLQQIQESVEQVVERVGDAVVGIGRGWHPGSGVVVAPGRVLTNAHNLGRDEIAVTFSNGRRAAATVAASDPDLDAALLEVDSGDVVPIDWPADAESPSIGTAVIALANPGGRGLRATPGFVSAAGRSFRGPRGRRISGCIEHTALLPRGSSGGPLVNPDGGLIGLNAVRLEGGLIVAVPAGAELRRRLEALARGDATAPARLGVAVAPARVAHRMRRAVGLPEREGVLVRAVDEKGAAAAAGIEQGDLIVAAAGQPVAGVDGLYEALDSLGSGATLDVTIVRGADERDLTIVFAEAAETAEAGR